MKRHFYFFRHGQSFGNELGISSRPESVELTEKGKEQAKKLSEFLQDKSLDIIYSSPFKRSFDTAKFVAEKYSNIPIITKDALSEAAFGFWYNDTEEKQKRIESNFKKVKECLEQIVTSQNSNNIAISSHGGITRALCWCAGHKVGEVKNCQCFHFVFEDNNWQLVEIFETGIEVQNKSDYLNNLM